MKPSVVVVGAGIVGCATAFELSERGVHVTLIDRDPEPFGASRFSFASLSAFDEVLSDVYVLKTISIGAWRAWRKRFGPDIGVSFNGELRWAEEDTSATLLRKQLARAFGRGYPSRRIDPAELRDLLPSAEPSPSALAVWSPEDGQVAPETAIALLKALLVESGATIVTGEARLLATPSGIEVEIDSEPLQASAIVVAGGAETQRLLAGIAEVPMDPSPGMLLHTHPVDGIVSRPTVYVDPEIGTPFHLRQLPDRTVLIGERGQDHIADELTASHAMKLFDCARRSFPILKSVELDHFSMEWRPMPQDRRPVVGSLPGARNVYVVTAHSGVTLAPALAEAAAGEVLSGIRDKRLSTFRPERFATLRVDAERLIEEAFESPPSAP